MPVLMFVHVTFSIKPILAHWQTNELNWMVKRNSV